MDNNWLVTKKIGDFIGLKTNCFHGVHPEFSMLTTKEFYSEDKIFLTKLAKSILSGNMHYYDHYLFFGIQENRKEIVAFIIVDPHDNLRFRVVKTGRPYYSDSLKIVI